MIYIHVSLRIFIYSYIKTACSLLYILSFSLVKIIWAFMNLCILNLHTKLRVFITNVMSVLLYWVETWRATRRLNHKLLDSINTCLPNGSYPRWPERTTNQEPCQGTRPSVNTIQIGFALHRRQTNIPFHTLDWNYQEKKRAWPAKTWRNTWRDIFFLYSLTILYIIIEEFRYD